MSDLVVRLQEKGQVTIPSEIRRKHKLKKGDLVVSDETEAGVEIKPVEILVSDALDQIGQALVAKGIDSVELIERDRYSLGEWVKDEYGMEY